MRIRLSSRCPRIPVRDAPPRQTTMNDSPPGMSGVLRGVVLMTVGCVLVTVNDTVMKLLSGGYPPGETIFVRGVFVSIPVALLMYRGGGLHTLRVTNRPGTVAAGHDARRLDVPLHHGSAIPASRRCRRPHLRRTAHSDRGRSLGARRAGRLAAAMRRRGRLRGGA